MILLFKFQPKDYLIEFLVFEVREYLKTRIDLGFDLGFLSLRLRS